MSFVFKMDIISQMFSAGWAELPLARGKASPTVICYSERRHQYANRHKCIHKYTSGLCREVGEELGVSKSRH